MIVTAEIVTFTPAPTPGRGEGLSGWCVHGCAARLTKKYTLVAEIQGQNNNLIRKIFP